jgi:hypothetical protein
LSSREALWQEIRATARLSHPNIVNILDVRVAPFTTEIGGVSIEAGQDLLVMELLEGGALDAVGPLEWFEVKRVLVHVLAGLAHAHAHGVVHRDLKPGNILLEPQREVLLPKIADFGLAYLDPEITQKGSDEVGGTPAYMAPEQISGRVRDYGPWTDLYAVGCMAYELVAGRPPYVGAHYLEVLQAHREAPFPPLPPHANAPEGFEAWLRRLLAKRPRRRFLHAADAAFALMRLPAMEATAAGREDCARTATTVMLVTSPWQPTEAMDAVEGMGPTENLADDETLPLASSRPARRRETSPRPSLPLTPPFPTTWRHERRSSTLRRTGVALHGVRPTPLLGRRHEQKLLWECLRLVHRTARPHCAVIRGPRGHGKTRLAEWLALQADELGAATVIRAHHDEVATQFHGLAGLFRRYFRLGGMEPGEAKTRVRDWLLELGDRGADESTETLVEWIAQQAVENTTLLPETDLFEFGYRLVELVSRQRPMILLLDDVQWGTASLAFARQLMQRADLPLLVLCTVTSDDQLSPRAQELVHALSAFEETAVLELSPVSPEAQKDLLTRHFGLQFEAAVQLLDRSDDDIVFMQDLLRDAIERGLIVPSPRGWELRESANVSLPADVNELMATRLERFAREDAPTAIRALEVAAVLGHRFEESDWRAACAQRGFQVSDAVVQRALEANVLSRGSDGEFVFVDARLDEAIRQRLREANRLHLVHRACAAALEPSTAVSEPIRLGRYARHLAASELGAGALRPILEAVRAIGDGRRAWHLLETFRRVASELQLPVDTPIVVEAMAVFGLVANHRLYLRPSIRGFLVDALDAARRTGDDASEAENLASLSYWELCEGSTPKATELAFEALEGVDAFEDVHRRATVVTEVAVALGCVGGAEEAMRHLDEVFTCLDATDPLRFRIAEAGADVARYGGLLEAERRWAERARSSVVHSPVAGRAAFELLEQRSVELRDEHLEVLRRADRIHRQIRFSFRHIRLVSRMLAALSQVRHEPGSADREVFEECLHIFSPTMLEYARVRLAQATLAMHADAPERAREFLDQAQPAIDSGKIVFAVGRDAEHAARIAAEKGFDSLARRLEMIAWKQREGLGYRPDVDR